MSAKQQFFLKGIKLSQTWTDSGVAVTVIEAVADVGVALALLEPKLF